jgi:outer membrane protein assembly factor BamB
LTRHEELTMRFLRQRFSLVLVFACVLLLTAAAVAGNWPRFRGPNGTGVAEDKDVPVRWTTDTGVLWKTALPGKGHSSPIVWNDRVFLQTASSDGKERSLVCLDANSGQIVWTQKAPGTRGKTHSRSSLASNTPATDGDRVYSLFWDGQDLHLCAYDFTGKQVWKRDLGGFTSQHGAGHSPIVHDGKVILANDQDGSAVLQAFDAVTGKDVWEVKRPAFRACYSTPCLNGKELLVGSTAGVSGYDPATGKELWKYTWHHSGMPLRTVASPIIADGVVIVNAGDGSGLRHTIAVKLGGSGDVSETHLVWENTKTLPYVPTMLAKGEYAYSVNDRGMAACHVARTGKEIWSERLGSPMTASPILVDGKIYAVGEDGKVYVYQAGPEYKLLATNLLGEEVSSTPALANGKLYIRGQQHLICIGKKDQ